MKILADVRSARNAVLPVNQLPMEVIAKIFSFLPGFIPCPDTTGFQDDPPFYRWITTTFVCRRWRAVALSFPSLWTIIDTGHMDATRTFIERSGRSPIDVYLRCKDRRRRFSPCRQHSDDLVDFIRNLAILLPRIRTLHVGIPDLPVSVTLAMQLEHPAPMLERLALCNGSPIVFPKPLFGSLTSSLTHLTIGRISSLPPCRFTNLVQFCLCERIDTCDTMSRIVGLLQDNPSLEELFFGHSPTIQHYPQLPLGTLVSGTDFKSVRLPYLRKLSFSGYTNDTVAQILSLLSLPRTVYAQFLNITCHSSLQSIEHMFLPNFVGAISMRGISRICIKLVDQCNLTVTCFGDTTSAFHIEIGTTKKFGPQFVSQSLDYLTAAIESGVCELKELWLDNIFLNYYQKLLAAASTPHLTKVVIRTHEGSSEPILGHFAGPSHIQRTPNLRVLDVSFSYYADLFASIMQFADARARLGLPLHHVTLCFVLNRVAVENFEEKLARLKQDVKEVECRFGQVLPRMDLPKICSVETHSHWPAWNV
jgi:F-box-like